MISLPRKVAAGSLAVALALGLAACSGDDADPSQNSDADVDGDGEATPEEVMEFAKTRLDETSGVRLRLSTEQSPDVDPFLQSASGVITRAPAFQGEATGTIQGQSATVQVVSVDDTFYAELPIVGWQDLDPDSLCAPDPAQLLDAEKGVSTVLTTAEGLEAGEAGRAASDNQVTGTPYTGTVPGTSVKNLLPCAPGDTFDATFLVDGEGELREAQMTGEFFDGADDLTYTIFINEYDVEQEITAP